MVAERPTVPPMRETRRSRGNFNRQPTNQPAPMPRKPAVETLPGEISRLGGILATPWPARVAALPNQFTQVRQPIPYGTSEPDEGWGSSQSSSGTQRRDRHPEHLGNLLLAKQTSRIFLVFDGLRGVREIRRFPGRSRLPLPQQMAGGVILCRRGISAAAPRATERGFGISGQGRRVGALIEKGSV